MDEASRVIVEIRVARAEDELRAVHELLEGGFYRIACARAYYAAFLMTTAVLLFEDVVRTKHSGVEAAFHENLIKNGSIESEYGKIYLLLRSTREESDYNDKAVVSEEMARQRFSEAKRFVNRLCQYLTERGAIGS